MEEVDRTDPDGWRSEITYRLPMQGLRETSYDLLLAGGDPHVGPRHIAGLRYRESGIEVVKRSDPSVELQARTESDSASIEFTVSAWPPGMQTFLTLGSNDHETCGHADFVPNPIAAEHAGCRVELLVGYIVHDPHFEMRGTGFIPEEIVRFELKDDEESITWTSEVSAQGTLWKSWLPMRGLPGGDRKRVLHVAAEACTVTLEGGSDERYRRDYQPARSCRPLRAVANSGRHIPGCWYSRVRCGVPEIHASDFSPRRSAAAQDANLRQLQPRQPSPQFKGLLDACVVPF